MKSSATIRPLFSAIANPRDIRHELGLSQQAFWSRIGVNQPTGSRYESGGNMPRPVRELLRLVHVEGVDITAIRGEDVRIIEYLKDRHPDLYKSMRKAVRQQNPSAAGVAA
ncbi:putative transcriptional regulator, XRE family protein [Laribacter hongkongensis HLHK9]|uniref:Putative transcriptional regulator, XRE family protein n=2 Tax=Laribacter hongkongensis TaxID=168471 RepID=C1D581_LARHH|nr:helix-turn-helix domain-containing protein [Laribacter hongkongensis]ACO73898.1 putative transcriptional regulator, XRE family protein [Laribacter hongkongensis HLHK9]